MRRKEGARKAKCVNGWGASETMTRETMAVGKEGVTTTRRVSPALIGNLVDWRLETKNRESYMLLIRTLSNLKYQHIQAYHIARFFYKQFSRDESKQGQMTPTGEMEIIISKLRARCQKELHMFVQTTQAPPLCQKSSDPSFDSRQ